MSQLRYRLILEFHITGDRLGPDRSAMVSSASSVADRICSTGMLLSRISPWNHALISPAMFKSCEAVPLWVAVPARTSMWRTPLPKAVIASWDLHNLQPQNIWQKMSAWCCNRFRLISFHCTGQNGDKSSPANIPAAPTPVNRPHLTTSRDDAPFPVDGRDTPIC